MISLKTMSTFFCLGLMTIALTSCRTEGGSGDLTVTIRPTSVYALPVKSTSCVGAASGSPGDLSSPSVGYSSIVLKWTNPSETYTLAYLDISIVSPSLTGGSWDYPIGSDELAALFPAGLTLAAMTDPANPPTMPNATNCGLRAGSIPLIDQTRTAFLTGVVKVVGYTTDADGNSTPVQDQIPISMQWQGLQ